MHEEQRLRTHDHLRAKDLYQALFSNSSSVTWLTGVAASSLVASEPFTAVWYDDGAWTLVVPAAMQREAERSGCAVATYHWDDSEQFSGASESLAATLWALLAPTISNVSGTVGVERRHLPAFLYELITTLSPSGVRPTPVDSWLVPLRMIKTDEEIAKLRASFALADVGQRAAQTAVWPGQREIDVWAAAQAAIERAAGRRVLMGNDCVSNRRRANIGGSPGELRLQRGDSCLVDLGTQLDGYWSDSCATYYVGEPSEQQRAAHRVVADALRLGASLVRPGATAGDIDRELRRFVAGAGYPVYPHHSGHGVGVAAYEEPRIVPYSATVLEPGMVILLEPAIYFPGELACRLEHAFLVTSTGAKQLTA